jgi:ceramide glucosyltransferase
MPHAISLLFFGLALLGTALVALQAVMVWRYVRRPSRKPVRTPGISILKPLCGIDDDLEENLRSFAALDYPTYEVILGVEKTDDPACAVAQSIVARWPKRFSLQVQQGQPGLNPKVNQLITLAKAARHEIVMVSDSNIRAHAGYLADIAACFDDPEVALVTHPIAGIGETRLGSLFDNFHMTTHFSVGMIAAKEFADQDLVIGKSMGFRRELLVKLGGFESAKNVLAEDFVMGRRVKTELHMKVAVGAHPVLAVSKRRSVGDFMRRYNRWAVMQTKAVGLFVYTSKLLMFPAFLAMIALLASPSMAALELCGAIVATKAVLDMMQASMLRKGGFPIFALFLVPVCDVLVGLQWFHGLLHDRVVWRGHVLEVQEGTVLVPLTPLPAVAGAQATDATEEPPLVADLHAR